MNKQVVYKMEEGGIGRLIPHETNRLEGESDEAFCSRMANLKVPKDYPWIVTEIPIPLDHEFRYAWVWSGHKNPKLYIDMEKAKEIWINKWRTAREPLLENLDVEYLKAVESKNEKLQEEISQKKQELRDITKYDLSSVNDVAELKKVWPSALEG